MRTLKHGDPCPCCGRPILLTDELELLALTCRCMLMKLVPLSWLSEKDEEENENGRKCNLEK